MPYIHIPQHRCARISTETPVDIEGLYTSGVFNCAIIILYSPDRTRSSMIHADASVEWRQIQTEIDWVGSGCEKFIIKTPAENSIEDIMSVDQRKTFRELPVREGFWGTALSRHGCQMIHYYLDKAAKKVFSEEGGRRKLGEPNMHRHPHEAAIKEIFLFNGYCPYFLLKMGHPKQEDLQYQFIIYDVNHWPKRDLHELQFTKFAHDCYTYLKGLIYIASQLFQSSFL